MLTALAPVSYWTPAELAAQGEPIPILADLIDPATGEFKSLTKSARLCDAHVIEAYRAEAGTGPALGEAGHTLRVVKHTTPSDLDELRGRTKQAVQHLIDAGMVEWQRAEASIAAGGVGDTVELVAWIKDLTTQNDVDKAKPFTVPRRRSP